MVSSASAIVRQSSARSDSPVPLQGHGQAPAAPDHEHCGPVPLQGHSFVDQSESLKSGIISSPPGRGAGRAKSSTEQEYTSTSICEISSPPGRGAGRAKPSSELIQPSISAGMVPERLAAFTANSVPSTVATKAWRPMLRPSEQQQIYDREPVPLQSNSVAAPRRQGRRQDRERVPLQSSTCASDECHELNDPKFCLDSMVDASGYLRGSLLGSTAHSRQRQAFLNLHPRVAREFDAFRHLGVYDGFWQDICGDICCRVMFDNGDCADLTPQHLCVAVQSSAAGGV